MIKQNKNSRHLAKENKLIDLWMKGFYLKQIYTSNPGQIWDKNFEKLTTQVCLSNNEWIHVVEDSCKNVSIVRPTTGRSNKTQHSM